MLYFESNLTEQEAKARDIMVYLFNPVLKLLLQTSNPEEFKRYGYNSCRQTAILGAGYLRKLLPDYEFLVYEGHFVETINGKSTPYDHAFIIAHKDDRHLVIDLSRTTKKLLFSETYLNIYPEIEDYEDVTKIGQDLLDLDALLNTEEPEYFTHMKPRELMALIDNFVTLFQKYPKSIQLDLCDRVYSDTTMLRR